jgi:hypothetical protein
MDKEKLILNIMKEAEADGEPITREEAEEMAEMEIKAKGVKLYNQGEAEKKPRKPKERKVDDEKAYILKSIKVLIEGMLLNKGFPCEVGMKNETELSFAFGVNHYTIKLIKHRPPKA